MYYAHKCLSLNCERHKYKIYFFVRMTYFLYFMANFEKFWKYLITFSFQFNYTFTHILQYFNSNGFIKLFSQCRKSKTLLGSTFENLRTIKNEKVSCIFLFSTFTFAIIMTGFIVITNNKPAKFVTHQFWHVHKWKCWLKQCEHMHITTSNLPIKGSF